MFSLFVCLFVCLFAGSRKNHSADFFTKFGGKVAHGPRKRPLDSRCSTDLDPDSGI